MIFDVFWRWTSPPRRLVVAERVNYLRRSFERRVTVETFLSGFRCPQEGAAFWAVVFHRGERLAGAFAPALLIYQRRDQRRSSLSRATKSGSWNSPRAMADWLSSHSSQIVNFE